MLHENFGLKASHQTENNIVRVTYQALASILGGTQSLHTNSKDEALGLPTQESVQTALRTQQIIAHETGIPNVIDPLGGSYYVESLTQQMYVNAKKILEKIRKEGGSIQAVHKGSIVRKINANSYKIQQTIDAGEKKIVGVNCFESSDEKHTIFRVSPKSEKFQVQKIKSLRKKRDSKKVEKALVVLKKKALTTENLFPYVLKAVQVYATVGEISDVLREVFGEFTPPQII